MSSYRGDGVHVNESLWAFLESTQYNQLELLDDDCQCWLFDLGREFPEATPAALYQIVENRYGIEHCLTAAIAEEIARQMLEDEQNELASKQALSPRVDADDFLRSFEWRRVRMNVLEARGARCECCGRTAAHGIVINVDHIKGRKQFPELALDQKNLQILCDECNHGKGNKYKTDWRAQRDHSV